MNDRTDGSTDPLLDLLADDERPPAERARLVQLMRLLAALPPPPDPVGLFPRYAELRQRFVDATTGGDGERLEERFLELYAHLHGHEAPYSPAERHRMDAAGGYWCHAGGLAPVLKAPDHLGPDSVSGDLGAGNGLQLLLMQALVPHRRSVQVEIASRMVEAGRALQAWLGVPEGRVTWVVGDVLEHGSPAGMDLCYLYRPVRPEGAGRQFYERFAEVAAREDGPGVIFSIADCLGRFLPPRYERFYFDGQLACYRRT